MPINHIIQAIQQLNRAREEDHHHIKGFARDVMERLDILANAVIEQDKKIKELEANLAEFQLLGDKR